MCENFKIYGNVLLVIMWAYTPTNSVMFSKTLNVGAEEGENSDHLQQVISSFIR